MRCSEKNEVKSEDEYNIRTRMSQVRSTNVANRSMKLLGEAVASQELLLAHASVDADFSAPAFAQEM